MPANMAATQRSGAPCGEAMFTRAGPGHMPARPQPAPKRMPPVMSCLSITLFEGRSNLLATTGRLRTFGMTRASMKGAVMPRPPAITNMRVGFHEPALTSRNWATLAAEVMPDKPRPQAKREPSRKLRSVMLVDAASALLTTRPDTAAYAATWTMSMDAAISMRAPMGMSGAWMEVTSRAEWVRDAATKPAPMKVRVYAMDLTERRALPLIPWPLVQPLPMPDPRPTARPPSAARHGVKLVALKAAG
mmetsp:Transcript_1077/g.3030  ORF Transcript_1077/g.3030 Transcript_1077/m.3030 type:complete len:247 (-) Transcript_1077:264-1004(-)